MFWLGGASLARRGKLGRAGIAGMIDNQASKKSKKFGESGAGRLVFLCSLSLSIVGGKNQGFFDNDFG